MSRKQPNPPPAGAMKPDPPPAPPSRIVSTEDAEARIVNAIDRALHPPLGHLGAAGVFARLDSFRDLAPGWDSYGAQPIDPRAIAAAQALLHSLTVVPTACGGVQIEAGDVEVEIAPDGRIVEDDPFRPWNFCSERQPDDSGEYHAAIVAESLGVVDHQVHRLVYRVGVGWTWDWEERSELLAGVYAWRPIVEDPPPLRPEDRTYLIDNGVPPEWLEPKGVDEERKCAL